jgi:mRNA interferase MazF
LDSHQKIPFCNQREIWWCCIGLNVGSEVDGKNELFERPVIIIKVFNSNMIRVAPLTSKIKEDSHHYIIRYLGREGSVILSQMKTISPKRLSRKMTRLDKVQFNRLVETIRNEF